MRGVGDEHACEDDECRSGAAACYHEVRSRGSALDFGATVVVPVPARGAATGFDAGLPGRPPRAVAEARGLAELAVVTLLAALATGGGGSVDGEVSGGGAATTALGGGAASEAAAALRE